MILSCWIFIVRIIADEICRESQKTHFVLVTLENCVIREILGKSMVEADKPQMTIQYGACTLHAW
jgi:hypothetical protein